MGDINFDGNNVVTLERLGISLEAVEDKIIVMHDEYKSGFECDTCKGQGTIIKQFRCICDNDSYPGKKNRFGEPCPDCQGDYISKREIKEIICPACNGKKALLVVPEIAKSLPTTGIVVSMGPETKAMKITAEITACQVKMRTAELKIQDTGKISEARNNYEFYRGELLNSQAEFQKIPVKLGARVVFSPHVGTMLPMKGNIRLKIMRVHEPLCVLYGAEIGVKEFMDFEVSAY